MTTAQWNKHANDNLKGKTIKKCRYMTKKEQESMMWYNRALVIEFTDGSLIFPSKDDEGNDAGALFGQTNQGDDLTFPVIS
jgi:hypothetical protein